MTQPLTSVHFPYVPIRVTAGHTTDGQVEALLDTGFDGEVILPPEAVSNGELPDWYVSCRLADGSELWAPAYVGSVRLGTVELNPVVVMALGDEPIIGLGVIGNFFIGLDHGQRVTVEP